MKAKTGMFYTDGTPIRDGDVIILHHTQESTNRLSKFVRNVRWEDNFAGYIAECPKHGFPTHLSTVIYDPNCVKITKKS